MTGFVGIAMSERDPIPTDELRVRATTEPIRQDAPAELTHAPDWNEVDTDESAQLTGLAPRGLASDTHDSVQSVPPLIGTAQENHNAIIDNQVSASGRAAGIEAGGVRGHGTMQYAIGIEPVLRDGAAFGNQYFVTNDKPVQEGMGEYMTPTDTDSYYLAAAQAGGVAGSRAAAQSTLFRAFIGS